MSSIKKYILQQVAQQKLTNQEALQLLSELNNDAGKNHISKDIAIIGMSCKLPLGDNPDIFWDNISKGVCGLDFWPMERVKDILHVLTTPQYAEFYMGKYVPLDFMDKKTYTKGGYLENIDKFDADFFGIPNREARYMDPRHRVLLETAWNTIEDAGYGGNRIYGSHTGVFLGMENTNNSIYQYSTEADPMHLTGGWVSIQASRISYLYNMRGPCIVVDTACSSGATAIHNAVRSIQNQECEMALAGGINLMMGGSMKENAGIYNLSSVESGTETVRTFDKNSNGTLWGEGVVMFLLKPLNKAIEDRDNIHAIIKSSFLNNDGASNGITAPNADAQEELLAQTWKNAEINPETINYIETHGTGTVLGDPIEIKGLTGAFRRFSDKKQFCAIGSLKPTMGHLVATSGPAAALKVIMSLKNKKMAPTINFETPNPYINFIDSPLYVNDKLKEWETNGTPRRAAISSFGFSGTNVHIVFEEYAHINDQENIKPAYCISISAKKSNLLSDYIQKYKEYIELRNDWNLPDLAYTSNIGRGHYNHRLAIIASDKEDFIQKINFLSKETVLKSYPDIAVYYNSHKIINNRKEKSEGELYMEEKKILTDKAQTLLTSNQENENYISSLNEIGKLYALGADINWNKFYENEKRSTISIPTYPLERNRFWADYKISKHKNTIQGKDFNHPLIEKCIIESFDENIYITAFNDSKHWVVSDHKILGNFTVPGSAFIEMGYIIGRHLFNTDNIELKDLFFLAPLMVEKGKNKETHIVVDKKEQFVKYTIATQDENNNWIKHAEGTIHECSEQQPQKIDIEELKKTFPLTHDLKYLKVTSPAFTFGRRWDTLENVYEDNEYDNSKRALLKQALKQEIKSDSENYFLHPGMVDNAINYLSQSFGKDNIYLPFNYKSFKVFRRIPDTFYSYIVTKSISGANKEIVTFDVTLSDTEGNVLILIKDYSMKRINPEEVVSKKEIKNPLSFYGYDWEKIENITNRPDNTVGSYIIFHRNTTLSDKIIDYYNQYKNNIISFDISLGVEELNNAVFSKLKDGEEVKKIIYIISQKDQFMTNDELEREEKITINSFYHSIKELIKHKIKPQKGISIIAEEAYCINGNEAKINPLATSAFGLSIVIEKEYEQYKCKNIDIDNNTSIDNIISEIENNDNITTVGYRNNLRYQSVFSEIPVNTKSKIEIKQDGVYLITGGTGGIGLEFAKFLSDQKKIKLVLVNRSKFPERTEWEKILDDNLNAKQVKQILTLQSIEENGSEIHLYSTDIGDYESTKKLISEVNLNIGKINGIIHAAGIAGQGFLINKDEKTFSSVLKPKIQGTWNLAQLTSETPLDFFALFSSMTTLMGVEGQGDYSAANAFLNGFAAKHRQQNVVSIMWPAWSETGMAVDFNVSDEFVLSKSISTSEALKAFIKIMESGHYCVMPGKINYPYLSQPDHHINLSEGIKKKLKEQDYKSSFSKTDKKIKQEVIISGRNKEELTEIEIKLSNIWAEILELTEIDIFSSFQELGGNSILGTHLLKAIETEYPGTIDISDIYSYPTIVQLSEIISKKICPEPLDKKEETSVNDEDDLKLMLNNISEGNLSIDDAISSLLSNDK